MSGGTSPAAAEHARLVAEIAPAGARLKDLQANRPDRGDTEACTAHKAREDAASEAAFEAQGAADCHLREHPELVPAYGAARRWQALGICSVPVRNDGSKAPFGWWKQYQERLPTDEELWTWHHRGDSGLGLVTGRTERDDGLGLEMFEFEGRAVGEGVNGEFLGYIAEAGLSECWARIMAGYWEISPSEGLHVYWLAPDVSGNVKLAQRLATPEELAENPKDKYRTLIESRGKGGFSVAAPTPGSFHQTGRPWLSEGSPENLAVITAEEREGVFACARRCHKVPKGAIHERPERAKHETLSEPGRDMGGSKPEAAEATRPGDIYNQRGPDWAEILEPHGWRQDGAGDDGEIRWTRPGKASGPSATTGNTQHEGDKLHCFTSSTEFEPDESYSKFAVYAILNHEGDFAAAAAQLRKEGYVIKDKAAADTAGGGADGEITDSHLAEQFASQVLAGKFCWVNGWGWMAYRQARNRKLRGDRWFRTDDTEMTDLAREWLLNTYEAVKEDNPGLSTGAKKAWRSQLAGRHVKEVLSLAAGVRYIKRDAAGFDADPDLLNCANGVADLRSSTLMDHDPALLFTKSTGVDFVAGATHADWDRALTALPAKVLPWYQVRIGQAATGFVPSDEALMMNVGQGENGKTTVMQGLRRALGDYYEPIPVKALLGDSREHDTVLMVFKGVRLAALEETPEEGRLNMQQVKAVSTPQITGRYMRQDYVTYDSTHATLINTNHEPMIENADHGSLRRVFHIVWPYRYLKPGQKKVLPTDRVGDPGLKPRIMAGQQGQHEAILAWMVKGARLWYEAGRVMPKVPGQVQADTSDWLNRMNLIFAFGIEHLRQDTTGRRIMSAELYQVFRRAIKDTGNTYWSERTFNRRLTEFAAARGWQIEKKKTKHDKDLLSQPSGGFPADPPASYQAWHGIRFTTESDDESDDDSGAPGGEKQPAL